MIKISRLADYAVVVLATLAKAPGETLAASTVAEKSRLPEPTVAKTLKLLANGGLVTSVRGAGGGYALSRTPSEISIADVIASVDGPISLTACVEGSHESCAFTGSCPVHGRWDSVNVAIRGALEDVTLDEMINPSKPVKSVLFNEERL